MAGTTAPKKAAKAKMKPSDRLEKKEPRVIPTEVTPADEWLVETEGTLMALPSGKVVRMERPGMTEFLQAGLIPNELMPIVMKSVDEADPKGPSNDDLKAIQNDPTVLLKLTLAIDKIFVYCVTEPIFHMPPETRADRLPGVLYVDKVSEEDKTFIFQCAIGGTTDVEDFRARQNKGLAALQSE